MKNLIALVFVLLAGNSFAGTGSGQVSSVQQIGGFGKSFNGTTSLTASSAQPALTLPAASIGTAKTLFGPNNSGTALAYQPFYDGASASIYQVPSGKKFYVTQICYEYTGTLTGFTLGTATASFSAGTSVPTGSLYIGGGVPSGTLTLPFLTGNVGTACYNYPFSFAANLYPFWIATASNASAAVMLIGVEQ